jgi:DNA repair ATPase RecN
MITTLHIKNIGIIDDLSVELNNGFNVFTGETGAGKTLIIDAINIISGGRFSKEMIRRGEEYSFVELNLYLPDNERAIDGNVIVSREIHINGRNSCKINGRLVTVTELKEFMNKRYATVLLPSNMTDAEFQNQILDERHRELYAEGQRWYDLKRTNRLDLFSSLNGRNYLMYYPVPQSERDLAGEENYPQNEGY